MVKNLRTLREKNGWSQEAVGMLLGVSQQAVAKYETQQTQPDLYILIRMAKVFNTSVDYLIGATDIERRYEYVTEDHLNEDERRVMEKYREANYTARKTVEAMLDIALQTNTNPPDLPEENE